MIRAVNIGRIKLIWILLRAFMNRIVSTRSILAACLALAVLVTVCPAEETRRIHGYRIELGRFADRPEADQSIQSAAERASLPLRVDSLEGGWVVTSEDYSTLAEAESARSTLIREGFDETRLAESVIEVAPAKSPSYAIRLGKVENLLSAWQPQVEMLSRGIEPVHLLREGNGYTIQAGEFSDRTAATGLLTTLHQTGYPDAEVIELPGTASGIESQLISLVPVETSPEPPSEPAVSPEEFQKLSQELDRLKLEQSFLRMTPTPVSQEEQGIASQALALLFQSATALEENRQWEAARMQYRFILEQAPGDPDSIAGLARVEEIINRKPSPQPTASPSPEPSATPSPSSVPTTPPVAAPAPPSQAQPDVPTPPISKAIPFPSVLAAWPPAVLLAAGFASGAGAVLLIFILGRLLRGKRPSIAAPEAPLVEPPSLEMEEPPAPEPQIEERVHAPESFLQEIESIPLVDPEIEEPAAEFIPSIDTEIETPALAVEAEPFELEIPTPIEPEPSQPEILEPIEAEPEQLEITDTSETIEEIPMVGDFIEPPTSEELTTPEASIGEERSIPEPAPVSFPPEEIMPLAPLVEEEVAEESVKGEAPPERAIEEAEVLPAPWTTALEMAYPEERLGLDADDWEGRYEHACLLIAQNRLLSPEAIFLKMVKEPSEQEALFGKVVADSGERQKIEFDLCCLSVGEHPMGMSLENTRREGEALEFGFYLDPETSAPRFRILDRAYPCEIPQWNRIRLEIDAPEGTLRIEWEGHPPIEYDSGPGTVFPIDLVTLRAPAPAEGTLLLRNLKILRR